MQCISLISDQQESALRMLLDENGSLRAVLLGQKGRAAMASDPSSAAPAACKQGGVGATSSPRVGFAPASAAAAPGRLGLNTVWKAEAPAQAVEPVWVGPNRKTAQAAGAQLFS